MTQTRQLRVSQYCWGSEKTFSEMMRQKQLSPKRVHPGIVLWFRKSKKVIEFAILAKVEYQALKIICIEKYYGQ
jgi:hypothetical protein